MPYNKDLLRDILLRDDCRTLDNNGKILPPSNQVYRVISDRMALEKSHIKSSHVYTIVNTDRNRFRTLLIEAYKLCPQETSISTTHISDNSFIENNSSESEGMFSKELKIILSSEKWLQIYPKKKFFGNRVYWKLQEGWADVIAEKICQQHNLINCVFSFKNNLVTPTATARYYAKFVGICIECRSKITGYLQKEPTKEVNVIFSCLVENIVFHLHTGERKR